jgi:hypothetical protein
MGELQIYKFLEELELDMDSLTSSEDLERLKKIIDDSSTFSMIDFWLEGHQEENRKVEKKLKVIQENRKVEEKLKTLQEKRSGGKVLGEWVKYEEQNKSKIPT